MSQIHPTFENGFFIGFIRHENLVKALKLEIYYSYFFGYRLQNQKIAQKIEISKEIYYLYFLLADEEIRGEVFVDDNITAVDNNIIEVNSNIIDSYFSNEKYCTTLATFNSLIIMKVLLVLSKQSIIL